MVTHNDAIKYMADRVVQLRDGHNPQGLSERDSGLRLRIWTGKEALRRQDEKSIVQAASHESLKSEYWKISGNFYPA